MTKKNSFISRLSDNLVTWFIAYPIHKHTDVGYTEIRTIQTCFQNLQYFDSIFIRQNAGKLFAVFDKCFFIYQKIKVIETYTIRVLSAKLFDLFHNTNP